MQNIGRLSTIISSCLVFILLISSPAQARNEYKEFSIKNLKELDAYQSKVGDEVKFYFGTKLPKTTRRYGEWPSLKKTNAFNKTDEYACQWAMISALMSLKKRALREGGNAVFVQTNNDHRKKASATNFECEIGNIVASVAVIGTVVSVGR